MLILEGMRSVFNGSGIIDSTAGEASPSLPSITASGRKSLPTRMERSNSDIVLNF